MNLLLFARMQAASVVLTASYSISVSQCVYVFLSVFLSAFFYGPCCLKLMIWFDLILIWLLEEKLHLWTAILLLLMVPLLFSDSMSVKKHSVIILWFLRVFIVQHSVGMFRILVCLCFHFYCFYSASRFICPFMHVDIRLIRLLINDRSISQSNDNACLI